MSLNHFVSDLSQTHWWQQPQQHEMMEQPSKTTSSTPSSFWSNSQFFTNTFPISCSALRFDLNNQEDKEINHKNEIIKEPLFEKPLTPSDVGKLNRLVIPKQHAEKHFPLNGVSESGEKGLLLSFEDELGKPWRFRYSYWNSSQSYVLTKGWSRFVKEKKLNAGDIVQFERHRLDCERMFIGWRKRRDVESAQPGVLVLSGGGWQPYQAQPHPAPQYPPDSVHAATAKIETIKASGNCKRLRLFGVTMECQPSDDSDSSSHQSLSPDPNLNLGPNLGLGQCLGPANYNNQRYR